jgi:hypothetical protein
MAKLEFYANFIGIYAIDYDFENVAGHFRTSLLFIA